MKKKIYFLISSIIQIVMSIYAIINANELIKSLRESASIYPEMLQARINAILQNSGHAYIYLIAGITIILNSFIVYFALSNKLAEKKKKVIAFSIISFFTATYSIIEILAVINVIVMATVKVEKKQQEKLSLPSLKKEEVNLRKVVLAIVLLGVYFSQFLWKGLVPDNFKAKIIVSLIFYLLMIILSIIFFYDLFEDNFKVFKENIKAYYQNLIGKVGKFYLAYIAIAMVAFTLAKMETTTNQSSIESLPLWFSFPLAVIYAPIVEETLFRGCIRRFIKNDIVFIVVSAVTFGLLHTIFSETSIYNAIILGIPYMTIGGFLAYLYTKTNNIFTNISFHAFHNLMAMIITILLRGI